jgi:glycosyltransferase involved in cell wall biosynthesis
LFLFPTALTAMRVAIITTDNREPFREYHKTMPWFGTAPEALLQGMAQLPDLEVHVIGCTQRPMASSPEKLADNIWFHSLLVPKFGWLRTGYQGCIRGVRRLVGELKPHIVHGQGTERECGLSAVFSGFPNVLTIHGNMRQIERVNQPKPFTYGWLAARLEAVTIPRSCGVVCITAYTQRAVAGLTRRTWVVPNAVDASFFEISAAASSPPLILCVGNISTRKNQNAFMRALDPLRASHPFNVRFVGVAGKHDLYGREFFRELQSRPWCSYEGFADRSRLKSHLKGAALLVLPSLEDNCPMAVLEAMAAGVPVVAADVGGVPELITTNKTGLLCDPTKPTSITAAIEKLLEDPNLAKRLANEAKAEAYLRFHPKAVAQQHLDVYREVLNPDG